MGVHRFYETLKKTGLHGDGNDADQLTRFYYDDISDEVMTRTFKVDGNAGHRPVFEGEHRAPVNEMPDEVRRRVEHLTADRSWIGALLDWFERRMIDTLNGAMAIIEGTTHAMRESVHRALPASHRRTSVWPLLAGVALLRYAMTRHRGRVRSDGGEGPHRPLDHHCDQ